MAQCLSFYTWCSTLGVGCYLYTNIKRTTPVSAGWVSDGTTNWQVNSSGMITGSAACVYNYRAYSFGSNGYAGTISWVDCNGTTQSVYNDGSGNWWYIVQCALEGSVTWSSGNPNTQGCYMSIGFPCDCTSLTTCENYTIVGSRTTGTGVGSIEYIDCSGNRQLLTGITNGQTVTICARKGSIWNYANNDYIGNILNQGVTQYTGGGTRGITDNGTCLPYGTFINTICYGYDLYYIRANGSGGTYEEFIESNSTTCGYTGGGPGGYSCNCGWGCEAFANPCYYYGCSTCSLNEL